MPEEANALGNAGDRGSSFAIHQKMADFWRVFKTINRGGTVSIVEDRVSSDIGTRKPLQLWTSINWGQVKKRVRTLRQRIARRQEYNCPGCGESLFNGEMLHIHHKIPRSKGGKDCLSNWLLLHDVCHRQCHASGHIKG